MRVILRNLKPATLLSLNFTGFDVIPIAVAIDPGKSQIVHTTLSIKEFRAIPVVATELGAGDLSISASGGMQNVN
ncbi:hypothetical protein KAR91_86545 [Candidatus Pacearchaeota archaeon]|nr:hypothetical protein [Candidatus Pacearchaeota archaeon]